MDYYRLPKNKSNRLNLMSYFILILLWILVIIAFGSDKNDLFCIILPMAVLAGALHLIRHIGYRKTNSFKTAAALWYDRIILITYAVMIVISGWMTVQSML